MATGDTSQNKPVDEWSTEIEHQIYAYHCISTVVPNQIKLTLNKIESLKCDICGKQVKDYQNCISVFVYCNILCLEKLFMNHLKLLDMLKF